MRDYQFNKLEKMKQYDFLKAKTLITENVENLQSASLGMHEDWSWTAEPIWEEGNYKKELPENADEIYAEYREKRKAGISMLSDEANNYSSILIGGIYGSDWATPTLQLCFKDGTEKMIEVSKGESKGSKPAGFELGVLSQPVQDAITPLSQ